MVKLDIIRYFFHQLHLLLSGKNLAKLCEAMLGVHWLNIAIIADSVANSLFEFILNTGWLVGELTPAPETEAVQ